MIDYSDLALEKDDSELEFMDLICKYDYDLWDEKFEITPEFVQTMRGVILRMFEHNIKESIGSLIRIYSNVIKIRYKACDTIDYIGIVYAIYDSLYDNNKSLNYYQKITHVNYYNEAFNNIKNDIWDGRYIRDNNLTIKDFSFERIIKDLEEIEKEISLDYYGYPNVNNVIRCMKNRLNDEPLDTDTLYHELFDTEDHSLYVDDLMLFFGDNIINNSLTPYIIRQMRRVLTCTFESMKNYFEGLIIQIYQHMIYAKYTHPYNMIEYLSIDREVTELTKCSEFTYYLNYWIHEFDDGRDIFEEEFRNDWYIKDKIGGDEMPEEIKLANIIHPRYILEKYKEYDEECMHTKGINRQIEFVNRKWGI